jgi:D-sedoheptulose 7-phosphate isomerase
MSLDSYIQDYLSSSHKVLDQIDQNSFKKLIEQLIQLKNNSGRLFLLGVGGSAGNCSHAVNDFRKICNIETYAPTDNVSELTARTNDCGFDTIFSEWLKTSHLNSNDAVLVFSVGGGNIEKNISTNIVKALQFAKSTNAQIFGIVSRDGGYTKQVADVCILIPTVNDSLITPMAESFQALIWHAVVNYDGLAEK